MKQKEEQHGKELNKENLKVNLLEEKMKQAISKMKRIKKQKKSSNSNGRKSKEKQKSQKE